MRLSFLRCQSRGCSYILARADSVGVLEIICPRCGCKQIFSKKSDTDQINIEIIIDNVWRAAILAPSQ
jgi:phage FluMu protein Com